MLAEPLDTVTHSWLDNYMTTATAPTATRTFRRGALVVAVTDPAGETHYLGGERAKRASVAIVSKYKGDAPFIELRSSAVVADKIAARRLARTGYMAAEYSYVVRIEG
jgi:hypothetical protein